MGPIEGVGIPLQLAGKLSEVQAESPRAGLIEEAKSADVSFAQVFGELVASANTSSLEAKQAARALAEGRSDDIHGVMIATQEAAIQTRLVGNIKNKVVDAFYELWRMNI